MLLKLETIYKIVKWHQVTHIFFLRIYKRVNGWVKLELLLFFFLLCYFSIFLQFLISIFIMLIRHLPGMGQNFCFVLLYNSQLLSGEKKNIYDKIFLIHFHDIKINYSSELLPYRRLPPASSTITTHTFRN